MADLELDSEGTGTGSGSRTSVRRNIALKLKPQSTKSSKGVPKKTKKIVKSGNDSTETSSTDKSPLFPKQGKEELVWNQEMNLVGEKVDNANIHQCEKCILPVVTYGRFKKCKHSFCMECAQKAAGKCPKCGDENQSLERGTMEGVYICCHGGSRHGFQGCRKSYLSQRDLQAHVKYRHEGGQEAQRRDKEKGKEPQQPPHHQQPQQPHQMTSGMPPPFGGFQAMPRPPFHPVMAPPDVLLRGPMPGPLSGMRPPMPFDHPGGPRAPFPFPMQGAWPGAPRPPFY